MDKVKSPWPYVSPARDRSASTTPSTTPSSARLHIGKGSWEGPGHIKFAMKAFQTSPTKGNGHSAKPSQPPLASPSLLKQHRSPPKSRPSLESRSEGDEQELDIAAARDAKVSKINKQQRRNFFAAQRLALAAGKTPPSDAKTEDANAVDALSDVFGAIAISSPHGEAAAMQTPPRRPAFAPNPADATPTKSALKQQLRLRPKTPVKKLKKDVQWSEENDFSEPMDPVVLEVVEPVLLESVGPRRSARHK